VFVTQRKFAQEHPEALDAFIAGMAGALSDFRKNPDGARDLMSERVGISKEDAQKTIDTTGFMSPSEQLEKGPLSMSDPNGAALSGQQTADQLYELGFIPKKVDLASTINPKFLENHVSKH
jgi:NitT/TauT family transport system substrate-binding protein